MDKSCPQKSLIYFLFVFEKKFFFQKYIYIKKLKELKAVNKDDKNDEDASDDSAFDSAASNSSEYFTFELKKIDLKVKHGQLVMVCGGVGSGKSSLLSALLNEMNCIDGQ